jgi:hypothetical protein
MLVSTRERREAWLKGRAGASDVEIMQKQWSELWHIKVPSNVRVFLWRLAKQYLPMNDVRCHRRMAETDSCQLCGARDF